MQLPVLLYLFRIQIDYYYGLFRVDPFGNSGHPDIMEMPWIVDCKSDKPKRIAYERVSVKHQFHRNPFVSYLPFTYLPTTQHILLRPLLQSNTHLILL